MILNDPYTIARSLQEAMVNVARDVTPGLYLQVCVRGSTLEVRVSSKVHEDLSDLATERLENHAMHLKPSQERQVRRLLLAEERRQRGDAEPEAAGESVVVEAMHRLLEANVTTQVETQRSLQELVREQVARQNDITDALRKMVSDRATLPTGRVPWTVVGEVVYVAMRSDGGSVSYVRAMGSSAPVEVRWSLEWTRMYGLLVPGSEVCVQGHRIEPGGQVHAPGAWATPLVVEGQILTVRDDDQFVSRFALDGAGRFVRPLAGEPPYLTTCGPDSAVALDPHEVVGGGLGNVAILGGSENVAIGGVAICGNSANAVYPDPENVPTSLEHLRPLVVSRADDSAWDRGRVDHFDGDPSP